MFSIDDLNYNISELYEKVWKHTFVPPYTAANPILDDRCHIDTDYIISESISTPYIVANNIFIENNKLYYIMSKMYINCTIENYRLLNIDKDDHEVIDFCKNLSNDFMKELTTTIIKNLDNDDFIKICNNDSRRFFRSIQILKNISSVKMSHLPNAKVFSLEDFIEFQLLKGQDYADSIA